MPSLSIIMPSLNEECYIQTAIRDCLEALDYYEIEGEVIVVNDGSTDKTKEILDSLKIKDERIYSITHDNPMGIGASFMHGVEIANFDTVVMFPGDGENDPNDSLRFFNMMQYVDILVPFIHNVEMRDMRRRWLSSIFRLIINLSFGIHLNYTNGTVYYNRKILKEINLSSSGFFYQAELLIKLIRKGYIYAEVPNFLSSRVSGKSKAISIRSLINVIKSFLVLYHEIHLTKNNKNKDYNNLTKNSLSYKYIKSIKKRNN